MTTKFKDLKAVLQTVCGIAVNDNSIQCQNQSNISESFPAFTNKDLSTLELRMISAAGTFTCGMKRDGTTICFQHKGFPEGIPKEITL